MTLLLGGLQAQRLVQLQAMTQEELGSLIDATTHALRLPRLNLHFQKHGSEFQTETPRDYEQLFLLHLQQPGVRHFTFLTPIGQRKIWYLLHEATGDIALYNETRGRHWSFFRHLQIARLLDAGRAWWVEVYRAGSDWVAKPW